jgi:hypothetical protein
MNDPQFPVRQSHGAGGCTMNITEDVRKYAAEQAISKEAALKKGMEEKVEGFEPPGGEREDVCAANGRRPSLREQTSQFVEKCAEVYAKACAHDLASLSRAEESVRLSNLRSGKEWCETQIWL